MWAHQWQAAAENLWILFAKVKVPLQQSIIKINHFERNTNWLTDVVQHVNSVRTEKSSTNPRIIFTFPSSYYCRWLQSVNISLCLFSSKFMLKKQNIKILTRCLRFNGIQDAKKLSGQTVKFN